MSKRAVCMASNYEGTSSQLAGCLNDANDWAAELERRGYEVVTLLGREASKVGILGTLERAVAATKYRDQLVVTYSGHGTWVPDRDGDEADGRDEAICPDDYPRAGMVTDDDLYGVFSVAEHGERIVMVSDSCHSGSLNRLAGPVEKEAPAPPDMEAPDTEALAAYYDSTDISDVIEHASWVSIPRRVRFLPPAEFLGDDLDAARAVEHLPARGIMRRGALVLSACAAGQVTYDTVVGGRPCGIFSHVSLAALAALPDGASYRDLHRAVRRALPSVDYPDVSPALDGTATQKRWTALA